MKMLRMLARTVSLLRQHQQHHQNFQQKVSLLPQSTLQCFRFSSSLSPQPNQVETSKSHCEQGSIAADDLVKLGVKKEFLRMNDNELLELDSELNDKDYFLDCILRSCEFAQSLVKRTRRVVQNSKDFSIQSFLEPLLRASKDVGTTSSFVKHKFSEMDASKDTVLAVPLLEGLLYDVEVTCKNMAEVSLLSESALQRFGASSAVSPKPNEKETCQSPCEGGSATADSNILNEKDESDLDLVNAFRDYLVKIVLVKEELLKIEHDKLVKLIGKLYQINCLISQELKERERIRQEAKKYKKLFTQKLHA